MDHTPDETGFRAALLAALCVVLAGCATPWHWPWHRHQPPPQPVHDVTVQSDDAASILQYWDRNTLQLDLTALSGEGTAIVTPVKSVGWPIRIEFLVRPGSFGRLQVSAAQRVVFEVPPRGKDLVMKLAPGAYGPQSQSITLRWSAADDSGH